MVSLVSVFVSLYDSLKKNISILNSVLPNSATSQSTEKEKLSSLPTLSKVSSSKSKTNAIPREEENGTPAQSIKSNSSSTTSLSRTSSHHSDGSDTLFPTSITINNEIFQDSQFTQCSNQHTINELSKMIRFEKNNQSNTMNFKFDINSHMNNKGTELKGNEFLNTPSPSSVENTGYGSSSGSSASSLNNFETGETEGSQQQVQPQQTSGNLEHHHQVQLNNQFQQNNQQGPNQMPILFQNDHQTNNNTHLPTPPTVPVTSTPATITTTTKFLTKPVSTKDKEKTYICEYCSAEFKIRGYLTRHIKKHAINKAYDCPFYEENAEHKCHPNGGFSRRDTYKTHLKSRHFKYPKGTKLVNRGNLAGHCGLCNEYFDNNENWIEQHIENGECPKLPKDYQVRVKNSRNKFYEFPNLNKPHDGIVSPISNVDLNSTGTSPVNDKVSPQNGFNYQQQGYNMHSMKQQQQVHLMQINQMPQNFPNSGSYTSLNSLGSSHSSYNGGIYQTTNQGPTSGSMTSYHYNMGAPAPIGNLTTVSTHINDSSEDLFKHFSYEGMSNVSGTGNISSGSSIFSGLINHSNVMAPSMQAQVQGQFQAQVPVQVKMQSQTINQPIMNHMNTSGYQQVPRTQDADFDDLFSLDVESSANYHRA